MAPEWSPDGTRVAFAIESVLGFNIYVMNADGSGRVQLTTDGNSNYPSWSPDGSRLVFTHTSSGNIYSQFGNIYIMNADGSGVTNLNISGAFPAW